MKKNAVVFGLTAGLIFILWMAVLYMQYKEKGEHETNMWLGYGSMLVAFSFIFVGIKNYRDKYNKGLITFWKAFQLGLYITLIASTIYVLAWLVDFYIFMPDFMDKYAAHEITQAKAHGATAAQLAALNAQMASYVNMYKSPVALLH